MAARPVVRLLTFSALALYGALRWATLLSPAATHRMLALLVLAIATGAALAGLSRRRRPIAVATTLVALVAVFLLAGIPLTLVLHHHGGVIASGISSGLTELPRMIVPYSGANTWARTVVVLGGGLLLLDAAVLLAIVPGGRGDARRAAAALPLIALAIVPYTLQAPRLAIPQGLLLFVLIAAFVWGERLQRAQLGAAIAIVVIAGLLGTVAAPSLDTRRPLINYQAFANALTPSGVETFAWAQHYGPDRWPSSGKHVLRVSAAYGALWKTENLDFFDGTGWAEPSGSIAPTADAPPATPPPTAAATARWTQTLHITIADMYTANVVAAGMAQEPQDVPGGVTAGPSPGTWIAGHVLGPGDAYSVRVYDPQPTPAELAVAGQRYPAVLAYYRTMFVPTPGTVNVPASVVFPAFGTDTRTVQAAYAASTVGDSPYGAAYRLARRLAAGAATPYAFIERVYDYLRHGYRYDTDAPRSRYPLETFLFRARYGYCQQFAGAMALLLRMGGVPARVAVGFATGSRDASGAWQVSDADAHAWVEAWFPGYGWVSFDPTPPAPGQPSSTSDSGPLRGALPASRAKASAPAPRRTHARRPPSNTAAAIVAVVLALVAVVVLALVFAVRRRRAGLPSDDEILAELERALRRSHVTLTPGTTLVQLERHFRGSPAAVAYLRTLGRARYAAAAERPTAAQRRALRAQLAEGRTWGRLRALWALPPRW